MKYIITESKLFDTIYTYIDEMFAHLEFNWSHPYDVLNHDTGEEGEDPNRIEFYIGDYMDDGAVFRWYGEEYFDTSNVIAPIVQIETFWANELDGLFGEYWKEPFMVWFENKFELPVKTVE